MKYKNKRAKLDPKDQKDKTDRKDKFDRKDRKDKFDHKNEDQKQRISDGTHRMLLCFSITATCSLSYVHKLINQMKSTPPAAAAAATESKTTSGCS